LIDPRAPRCVVGCAVPPGWRCWGGGGGGGWWLGGGVFCFVFFCQSFLFCLFVGAEVSVFLGSRNRPLSTEDESPSPHLPKAGPPGFGNCSLLSPLGCVDPPPPSPRGPVTPQQKSTHKIKPQTRIAPALLRSRKQWPTISGFGPDVYRFCRTWSPRLWRSCALCADFSLSPPAPFPTPPPPPLPHFPVFHPLVRALRYPPPPLPGAVVKTWKSPRPRLHQKSVGGELGIYLVISGRNECPAGGQCPPPPPETQRTNTHETKQHDSISSGADFAESAPLLRRRALTNLCRLFPASTDFRRLDCATARKRPVPHHEG